MTPNPATTEEPRVLAEDKELLPSYTIHDGYRMPKGFPVDAFTSGLQYEAEPHDLFVSTYPKCGTTWMQNIVFLILHGGKPLEAGQRVEELFPHLEEVGAKYVAERPPLDSPGEYRLIKTHLLYNMTPQNPKAKYIFVVRNPKDVVVSYFHHTRGFERLYDFGKGSFDTYFNLFLKGEVDFGDYFEHLREWFDHRNDLNVFFITYEKLRSSPSEYIMKVAEFLGADYYPEALKANDGEVLKLVLEHSSLKSMKKNQDRWSGPRPDHHTPFVRMGSVGGWGELLQDDQAEQLDRRMKEVFTSEELEILGDKYHKS